MNFQAIASRSYDVIVVGGGPCGLAAALRLARSGLRVAIIERASYRCTRVGEHLPASALGVLQELGLQRAFMDDSDHLRCPGVVSWWGNDRTPHELNYFYHPFGHGLNLSRPRFDREFADHLRQQGVVILEQAKIRRACRTVMSWEFDITAGEYHYFMEAQFVLDASGRSASFSRAQGSHIVACEPQLAVIRRYQDCTLPAGNRYHHILIESCDIGWWYFAPLAGGRSICMLITDPDLVDLRKRSIAASWRAELDKTRRIAPMLRRFAAMTTLTVCSARSQRLDRFSGDRWLAIGDAAMTFDPLSSHGIAKGLRHGWMAGYAVSRHLGGDTTAIAHFSQDLEAIFSDYLITRAGYYATEQRWADSLFWRRRQRAAAAS